MAWKRLLNASDIGSNVQAYDANLADIAGMSASPADSNIMVGNGSAFVLESGSTLRTSIGLGSAATRAAEDTLTAGANLPDGAAVKAYGDSNWGSGGNADTVTVDATTADTTCFVAIFESASGSLEPQTDAGLTYNANTNALAATTFTGALAGNATTCTTASAGDSATSFFSSGSIAVARTDAKCTDAAADETSANTCDTPHVATNMSWTAGTSAGPVCNSSTGTDSAIPVASASASGVVTNAAQTFAGTKTFAALVCTDLDVTGTTTTINSTNTSISDASFLLNVADGETAFGNSASVIVFGDSTGATSTGRIINTGAADEGFKFMTGLGTNTPAGNNNVSDGGTYADVRMKSLVLDAQSTPSNAVDGMMYYDGADAWVYEA